MIFSKFHVKFFVGSLVKKCNVNSNFIISELRYQLEVGNLCDISKIPLPFIFSKTNQSTFQIKNIKYFDIGKEKSRKLTRNYIDWFSEEKRTYDRKSCKRRYVISHFDHGYVLLNFHHRCAIFVFNIGF